MGPGRLRHGPELPPRTLHESFRGKVLLQRDGPHPLPPAQIDSRLSYASILSLEVGVLENRDPQFACKVSAFRRASIPTFPSPRACRSATRLAKEARTSLPPGGSPRAGVEVLG